MKTLKSITKFIIKGAGKAIDFVVLLALSMAMIVLAGWLTLLAFKILN